MNTSFKTKTWIKIQDCDFIKKSETKTWKLESSRVRLRIQQCQFCQNFSKIFPRTCHHYFKTEFLSNFWHFSCMWLFFIACRCSRQKADCWTDHIVGVPYSKSQVNRLESKSCKVDKYRPSLHSSATLRNLGSMAKTSAHVLLTSKNRTTKFLLKRFGEYCGNTVLMATCYWPPSQSTKSNHNHPPWVLDSDKVVCCHSSSL